MIYLMTIKHHDGRVGQVLSQNFEMACKGLDWHVVDCRLLNAQIVEFYVLDKEEIPDARTPSFSLYSKNLS